MKLRTLLLAMALVATGSASAQPTISGPLSGSLGPGTFIVVGHLSIVNGDTLIIQPGTNLLFDGDYNFYVSSDRTLIAQGTETDSIRFLPNINNGITRWGHLNFNQSGADVVLSYCRISAGHHAYGGGLSFNSNDATVTHCTFDLNSSTYGGGIYCHFSQVIVNNCTFSGNSAEYGGGIYCDTGQIVVDDCIFTANSVDHGGGVYCVEQDSLTINRCSFTDNYSYYSGAGLFCSNGMPVNLVDCVFTDNETSEYGSGGSLYFTDNDLSISQCTFSGNYAESGGSIYADSSTCTIEYSSFTGNTGTYYGSAMCFNEEGDLSIFECDITGNTGEYYGCAIYYNCPSCTLDVQNCTISNNLTTSLGGAIYCNAFRLNVSNCQLNDNTATSAGAIYCDTEVTLITDCTINNNTCSNDAGGLATMSNHCTVSNCTISGNVAYGMGMFPSTGGGIAVGEDSFTLIQNCIIENNMADEGGGIYYHGHFNYYPSLTVNDCEIRSNTASDKGGGIYCKRGSLDLHSCVISGNSAGESGGGISSRHGNDSVVNCTIVENTTTGSAGGIYCDDTDLDLINTIVALNEDLGIYADYQSHPYVGFCNAYGNQDGQFAGSGFDPGYGVFIFENNNGDPCDFHGNISLDPLFEPGNNDYHLQADSPCIDAGDPDEPFDPDNTISDIGAHFYDQTPIVLTLTPTSPTELPAAGGSIAFDAHLVSIVPNSSPDLLFWTRIKLPDGTWYPQIQYMYSFDLIPYMDITGHLTQTVPAFAPPGEYELWGVAGFHVAYPTRIGDHISFTKTEAGSGLERVNVWTSAGQFDNNSREIAATSPTPDFELYQAYPNPFNPATTISVALPQAADLTVTVVNTLGQQVAVLTNGRTTAGTHAFVLDGSTLASGIYFIHATVPGELNAVQKVVLMK